MVSTLRFAILLFLIVPLASTGAEYNYEAVVGEWIQFSRNENDELGYYYLKIEPDFNGLFSYQFYGSSPNLVAFSMHNFSFEDGFLVLDDRISRRLVFSAYGGYRLTGVMWFYQDNGGIEEPFNTFFLRLSGLSADNDQPDVASIRFTVDELKQ